MTTPRPSIPWMLLAFAAGLLVAGAPGQTAPRMGTSVLLKTTTTQIPRSVALQVNDDRWEPGAETGRHQHPGPTLIYVLEGELSESTLEGTSTLKAGQAVWRPARHEHNVRNAGARPARAPAIHLDPAQ